MPGRGYAVDLQQGGTALGAGFLLTRCFVVTANHCLRYLSPTDERVTVELEGGHHVEGRVLRRAEEADLALIEILQPGIVPIAPPKADLARQGDLWRGLHRPSFDDPHLGGRVDNGTMDYACEGGGCIEVIQLLAAQGLGDYSGYSGGPVERVTPGQEEAVLGVLVEQYPDRQGGERSTNVLFAATIREVMARFEYFQTGHLLKVLDSNAEAPAAVSEIPEDRSLGAALKKGEALLAALKEWSSQDLLDPTHLLTLQAQVARGVIDMALGGSGDDLTD